jgi:23S rRNA (guanosine2251-2'-O)-methyltransferase
MHERGKKECVLVLDTIRSAHNTGSMFRTADGAGVSRIILCGYTPAPVEKEKARPDIAKVALGAERAIPWSVAESAHEAVGMLKAQGYVILALERTQGAKDILAYEAPQKFALIVGNEVDGVSPELLSLCDDVLEIPMRGMKESLNVSVSTGIALYQLLK